MAPSDHLQTPPSADEVSALAASQKEIYEQLRQVVSSTFPTAPSGVTGLTYHRHPDGGWYTTLAAMVGATVAQRHFEARGEDVLLVTFPKCGTTWLKALLYAAASRRGGVSSTAAALRQLASHNSHELVPFLESQVYCGDRIPDLSLLPAPRLFATHVPCQALPPSVPASGCKVVYLCRDPKDCFVSMWHFLSKFAPCDINEALEQFCNGASLFGPLWEHTLGYWRWHVEKPGQVLFLTYEDLTADTLGQLRRLAEFIGRPFTAAEEDAGVDREIVEACTLESMTKQEVNQSGSTSMLDSQLSNGVFFRRGMVGDWRNCLTPEMAKRIDEITERKFQGSGLVIDATRKSDLSTICKEPRIAEAMHSRV